MSSFDFQDFTVSKERGKSDIRVYFKVFFYNSECVSGE